MESQPKNPEFRNNPENFHPCNKNLGSYQSTIFTLKKIYSQKYIEIECIAL